MDDVVRARREVPRTCFGVEHVVRRGDERGERSCPPLVVAHGPERSHLRHGWASLPAGFRFLHSAQWRRSRSLWKTARRGHLRGRAQAPSEHALWSRLSRPELVDPSGRIEGRVWHDVDLLDSRFAEGDAVRVLGRVERFRIKLQLDVRAIEHAEDADPGRYASAVAGRRMSWKVSSTSSPARSTCGLKSRRQDVLGTQRYGSVFRASSLTRGGSRVRRWPARAHGRRRHDLSGAVQLHPRLRADLLLAGALLHDVGRRRELTPGPRFQSRRKGDCSATSTWASACGGTCDQLDEGVRAELLHTIASHHDARAARTAEAACLYHANQLDALAATRPVESSPG